MQLEPAELLKILDLMGIEFSYLCEEDVALEKKLVNECRLFLIFLKINNTKGDRSTFLLEVLCLQVE
ncbi:hypothetical protein [Nostoc piscinale]|uniref:hypothetical protein n=1 Tax=Nostoc piscinale TaxID=224012 RepID=UPI001F19437B|nr:hypothetical protein [Nostoc piscinale]